MTPKPTCPKCGGPIKKWAKDTEEAIAMCQACNPKDGA